MRVTQTRAAVGVMYYNVRMGMLRSCSESDAGGGGPWTSAAMAEPEAVTFRETLPVRLRVRYNTGAMNVQYTRFRR